MSGNKEDYSNLFNVVPKDLVIGKRKNQLKFKIIIKRNNDDVNTYL